MSTETTVLSSQPITPVSALDLGARTEFIKKTYSHLFVAILGFVAFEVLMFKTGLAAPIASAMLSVSWLAVLGAFMVVSWLASRFAHRAQSIQVQYAALAGFVIAEGLIFLPMLFMAQMAAPGVIQSAALVTLLAFTALTALVWVTKTDFSFFGALLKWGGIVALALIVGGVVFGFHLGTFFSVGMIAFAGGAILYDTSKILHHYPEDRYVGAALELFASVALMFWYVLRLFMSRD